MKLNCEFISEINGFANILMHTNIIALNNKVKNKLNKVYSNSEIQQLRFLIYENALGLTKIQTLSVQEIELSIEQETKLFEIVERLANNEPIEYILGETEFFNLRFKVNPAVLIPRPETEELVDWILKTCTLKKPRILDVGTGSGCIPIAIKHNITESKVYGLDVSLKAIEVANKNAQLNGAQVVFLNQNILNTEAKMLPNDLDILLSNPPYVRKSEKSLMSANVLNFEPDIALFVEDRNPLLFYNKIAQLGLSLLKANGMLFFEINEALGENVRQLLEELGYKNILVKKDINGKDRMIKANI
jgi:release factor glutamine methyltransferase